MNNVAKKRLLREQDKQHHLHPFTNPLRHALEGPNMVVSADGIYIHTDDGRKIMDVGSGLANVNIGYGNERLCRVAYETMRQLSFGHSINGRSNPWVAALSEKLNSITPDQFSHFFYASTGSDAIESAVKMAWHYWRLKGKPDKKMLISRHHSYHGNTIVAASLSGLEIYHSQFGLPFNDLVCHAEAPYWYRSGRDRSPEEFGLDIATSLEKQINEIGAENIAAFVGDAIQTGGGTIIPPASYWPEVRRICDKYDILLILDEVVSGFGKTGELFGFQNFNIEPDAFVMAKGLSSGYFPISSVAIGGKIGQELLSSDEIFAHIFTNCGHPVGAAVSLENIAIIEEEGLVDNVKSDIGPYFEKRLAEFLEFPCVGEVRSVGVLGAIEIDMSRMGSASKISDATFKQKYVDMAWERGLAMKGAGLVLPMIITRSQIDYAVGTLKGVFTEVLREC